MAAMVAAGRHGTSPPPSFDSSHSELPRGAGDKPRKPEEHEDEEAEEFQSDATSADPNSWSGSVSKGYGRKVYPMPAIPEDNEITEDNLPMRQDEILRLAMSGCDISKIPTATLPKDVKRAIELLQFALSNDSDESASTSSSTAATSSSSGTRPSADSTATSTSETHESSPRARVPRLNSEIHDDDSDAAAENRSFSAAVLSHKRTPSLISPLENVVAASDIDKNLSSEMEYDVCSKSHLIFHRYGWKKVFGRVVQGLSYLLFYSSFAAALSSLVVVSVFWSAGYSFQILFPGVSLLVFLFAFNVYLGNSLYTVIHRSIQSKSRSHLGKTKPNGRVAIVKGLVSVIDRNSYISNFNETSKCVVVLTCMKYRRHYGPLPGKWKMITRHLNAVDFRITDSITGVSSLVSAESASLDHQAHVFLHPSTTIYIDSSNKKEAIRWVGEDAYNVLESFKQNKNTEVVICESVVVEGQEISLMGKLQTVKANQTNDVETGTSYGHNADNPVSNSLVIDPIEEPHNVSFFSFYGLIPFFYPTWITGLIISDQYYSEHNLD